MSDEGHNRPNNSQQNTQRQNRPHHDRNRHNRAAHGNGQSPRPQSNHNPNQQNRNPQRSPNGNSQGSQGARPNGDPQKASSNNNRRRNNRKNRYQKRGHSGQKRPTGPIPHSERRPPHLDRAYEKYQNLLDQHLIARKKYFELFYRADPQQKNKLERNFYQTLYDLRDFEDKATDEIKDFLKIKTNGRAEDFIYSDNHALEKNGKLEIEGDRFEDPHFLPSQARANFAGDTEESSGTLDDYKSYKGLA